MKKTYNINLGGIVFHIDEDAYDLLDKYFSNLRIHFSKEDDAEEIIHDMELRISELFSERLNIRKQVITLTDVEEIIAQMGSPEELSDEIPEETNTCNEKVEKGAKRLFRNPDNKILGGVCSGIATYFGCDVTLLRIIFIIMTFFIQGIILFYVIAWIIIPEAKTASEKLSMKGMKVNVENIGKTVTDGFEKVNNHLKSEQTKSVLQKLGEGFVTVIGFLIKAFLVIAAICCTPILFALLVVCFSLFFVAIGLIGSLPAFFYEGMSFVDWSIVTSSPIPSTLLAISGILVIGIPIIGFIHFLMSTLGGWKEMPFAFRMTLLILWLIALGIGTFFMINFGIAAIQH